MDVELSRFAEPATTVSGERTELWGVRRVGNHEVTSYGVRNWNRKYCSLGNRSSGRRWAAGEAAPATLYVLVEGSRLDISGILCDPIFQKIILNFSISRTVLFPSPSFSSMIFFHCTPLRGFLRSLIGDSRLLLPFSIFRTRFCRAAPGPRHAQQFRKSAASFHPAHIHSAVVKIRFFKKMCLNF